MRNLRDFLAPDRVLVPLPGDTLAVAADSLLGRLVAAGSVASPEKLRTRIAELRSEDMIVLPDRAFVLHFRSDTASEPSVALGAAEQDVRREPDSHAARVVLLAVAPPRDAALLLQLVRGFARLLSRESAIEQVLGAGNADGVVALPMFGEYQLAEQLTVRDLMTEGPRTTRPDLMLRDAAREMIETGLGALPVVDDEGYLLGMLSERELVRHLLTTQALNEPRQVAQPGTARHRTVREVMTRQVLCVAPEQPIAEVASLMSNKDVDRVPVVREGKLVGYLTRGDIVRKLLGP